METESEALIRSHRKNLVPIFILREQPLLLDEAMGAPTNLPTPGVEARPECSAPRLAPEYR